MKTKGKMKKKERRRMKSNHGVLMMLSNLKIFVFSESNLAYHLHEFQSFQSHIHSFFSQETKQEFLFVSFSENQSKRKIREKMKQREKTNEIKPR
jgi:molybdopterin-biosynthesis enzyme MoeA-like protein